MEKSRFEEEMEYLHSLSQFMPSKVASGEVELGLDAIRDLLSRMGNPENDLKIIHVAGTNGKGSTIAFLSSILKESGYRTGVFTSPVLIRFTEQIRVFDESIYEISEEELCALIGRVRPHIEAMKAEDHKIPSEFEVITALSLLYFKEKECDFVILECGLGGRTDATNIIPSSVLSVITAIGLDHTEILGDTIEAIAGEKAGIIKAGGNVVVLGNSGLAADCLTDEGNPDSVIKVFADVCREKNAALHIAKPAVNFKTIDAKGRCFDYMDADNDVHNMLNLRISLLGHYQIMNASIAVKAALSLGEMGYDISSENIRAGLLDASWPCRFEAVHDNPKVIIDGCHNLQGVRAMLESFSDICPGRRIIFIAGVLRDKSYREMFEDVMPYAKSFHTVTVPSKRALPADELRDYLRKLATDMERYDVKIASHECVLNAIKSALNEAGADDIICAFGSLYYVGDVREYFKECGK